MSRARRRNRIVAPVDYRRDRLRWADLARAAEAQALAGPGSTFDGRERLAVLAGAAREAWTPAAPYPRGLVCQMLASTVLAWARQTDLEARTDMAPLVLACCRLVERLLADLEAATIPDAVAGARQIERAYRAPYAEG